MFYKVVHTIVLCEVSVVVCSEGEAVPCCGTYKKGSDHILIRNVDCFSGFEDNITACSYFNVTIPPSHDQDVGVRCKQG